MAALAEKTQVDTIITPVIKRYKLIGFPLENFNIWANIWWCYLVITNVVWIVLFCCHSMAATTVEDVCEGFLNVGLLSQVLSGCLTIRKIRNALLETVDNMKKKFWFHNDDMDATILAKHKMVYRILSSIDLGYAGLCYIGLVIFNLGPIYKANGKFPLDMTFPFKNFIKESPYYEITYVMQVVTIIIGGTTVVYLDILYIVGMGFVLIQVDMIKQKLKKLTSGNDGENAMYEKLKTYIAHHNVVLNLLQKIEESFRYFMLAKLFCDMMSLSVTTYLFSQQTSLHVVYLTIFGVCGSQPLMYCFFGDFVTSECASIGEEAYEVNWEEFGYKSVTSALSMMIQRSQKPVYMTAGGMLMFSLPNYVAFMKMMVSFFLVLKRNQ